MSDAESWPKFWGEVNNTSTFDGFAYPKRFYKSPSEREGLVIGTQQNAMDLVRALLAPWPGKNGQDYEESYKVLLNLKVPLTDSEKPGRYESPWMDRSEISGFVKKFGEFFELAGSMDVWFYANESQRQVVYDRHDILYYYGHCEWAAKVLKMKGYSEGEFEVPTPHFHNYMRESGELRGELFALEWQFHEPYPADVEE